MPKDITHIKDLVQDPRNARRRTPRSHGLIADALQRVGAARSIVIDEDDIVRAGNGVVEAAAEVGITKVKVVEADGETIIAVRRRNLSAEGKQELAILDNRTGELSEWEPEVLRALKAENQIDLTNLGFSNEELAKILPDPEGPAIKQLRVERPAAVVWVLLAIPIEKWVMHQAAVDAMHEDARYSMTVVRDRKDESDTPNR